MKFQIEVIKSKIHRVTVTQADLHYVGSITIDEALLEAANIIEGEKVQIMDIDNAGDVIIIASYALMDFEDAKQFKPWIVFPDTATNRLVK